MNEPIFILCDARTGSTLLRILLDTHPAICSPSELSLGPLCDQLYQAIQATLGQASGEAVEAQRARCLAETRQIVDGLLQRYCAIKGKRRWCEKAPRNLQWLDTLRSVFPDARYICLYRHCLDAVHSSIEMFGERPFEIQPYLVKHGGNGLVAFIDRWCDRADRLLAFQAEHIDSSLRVTYEDLVADPTDVMRRILAFVGEGCPPDLVDRVFSTPHDAGLGDPKIALTSTVRRDRVGVGRHLDLTGVSEDLRDRMRRTLLTLGYDEQPVAAITADAPLASPVRTDVGALFDGLFSDRLERHRHWLKTPHSDVGLIVRGPGGGAWTLTVDDAGARIGSAATPPPVSIAIEAADLLDAVNGRFTRSELRAKFALEGDLTRLDVALTHRLLEVMFGEHLRPEL